MIRQLQVPDAAALRTLRLEALRTHPEAFGASHDEASLRSVQDFADSIATSAPSAIFGAFDGQNLVGMAGVAAQRSAKIRHKATLWGIYVQPAATGRGLGRALVQTAIDHARTFALILQAGVATENATAARLYEKLGFVTYGTERRALHVNGQFLDEAHLALELH